jgi:diguanylate cyclase
MVTGRAEDRLRDRLSALHRIVARAGVELGQSREDLLAEALEALDLEFGAVTQVHDGIAYPTTFLARVAGTTPVRNPTPVDQLIASVVVAGDATFAAADLAQDPVLRDHFQVRERGVRAYVGTPIRAGEDAFVLTMGSTQPREAPFAGEDLAYVELLAALFAQSLRHEMQERSIDRLAHHCRLTGFPLEARMRERLDAFAAAGSPFALLALDIDVARILTEYDYTVFARLAAAVARRLETIVVPPLTIYRGHECDFFIVVPGEALGAVETLANDVRRCLALPFALDGREIGIAAAIGIASDTEGRERAEATIARAVAAVREARAGSRIATRLAPADDASSRLRTRMLDDLRGVAERDELVLNYQPFVRISDGIVCGVEALVRWQHPELGLLQPDAFVTLAEENESVVAIGMWVLRRAARFARRLADSGYAISVAVNVAGAQLQDVAFIDRLRFAAREAGVPPSALELEITETAALRDIAAATAVLTECRALGVRVALDDFGTAYASLAYLRDLPSDAIKIDRSFIGALPGDARAAAIASATIVLARRLGRIVHAEGVETAEQLAWLTDEHCDLVQGYYVSRPLDENALLEHLGSRRPLKRARR